MVLNSRSSAFAVMQDQWYVCMQAHLHLAEAVGAAAMLGLGRHSFLPDFYIDILVSQSLSSHSLQVESAVHKKQFAQTVFPIQCGQDWREFIAVACQCQNCSLSSSMDAVFMA